MLLVGLNTKNQLAIRELCSLECKLKKKQSESKQNRRLSSLFALLPAVE